MAYISQEEKKALEPAIKAVFKKYGVKGSIAIKHYSVLLVTIASGAVDFFDGKGGYQQINTYWAEEHYKGEAKEFLVELVKAMKGDAWFDESDAQADYTHLAYYLNVHIGKWDKPYVFQKSSALTGAA